MKIKRQRYLNKLIAKKDNGRVKIITGIRRCGKSYLLFELYKDHLLKNGVTADQIIEVSLEELGSIKYRDPFRLDELIKEKTVQRGKRYYVFIDEIQFCREVSNPYIDDPSAKITFVDTLLGLMKNKDLDIYITGSNSRMLSSDIVTQFRDRGDEIHVHPLTFSEFYPAYMEANTEGMTFPISFPFSSELPTMESAWREYCSFGGMPYILQLKGHEEKSAYLKELFEETYLKDIIERNDLRNDKEVLDILLDFVSSSIGSLTNPSKLANRFASEKGIRISHNTISRYLDMLKEAYILYEAKRYDIKGSQYFSTPLKYYFSDIGLRNARLNFRQIEETHIMENVIYNELIARGYNVDVGVVERTGRPANGGASAKRTSVQLEVDFVVNRINRRIYIQSALHIDDNAKREQETASLNMIHDSFKKIVIVKDDIINWQDEKGILYMSIKDFLLNEDSING